MVTRKVQLAVSSNTACCLFSSGSVVLNLLGVRAPLHNFEFGSTLVENSCCAASAYLNGSQLGCSCCHCCQVKMPCGAGPGMGYAFMPAVGFSDEPKAGRSSCISCEAHRTVPSACFWEILCRVRWERAAARAGAPACFWLVR